MPKSEKLNITPLIAGNKHVGFRVVADLLFTDFTDEKAGNEWSLPLRARGDRATGALVGEIENGVWVMPDDYKDHDTLSIPIAGQDVPLYVLKDGQLTPNPYIQGSRTPAPNVVLEEREATPHRDFRSNVTPEQIMWPDGNVRKLAFTIKANTPLALEQFQANKAEKVKRLQASTIKGAKTADQLDEIIRLATERAKQLRANGGAGV